MKSRPDVLELGVAVQDCVPCNLCGEDDPEVLFEPGVAQVARIVRCKNCGLMYASPRGQLVDADDYQRFEPEGLLEGVSDDESHPYRWRLDKEKLQVRDFESTTRKLRHLHPNQGHMVEVGSGLGYLLRSFQDKGWSVEAIDPWPELSTHTKEAHGFETAPMTLEQASLPSASVDVLVMLHVIEHVPDPVGTLSEIFRVLKPGGHAVIETPRYDTVTYKIMGRRERSLRQDGHIYFFTTATLRDCYQKVGFREVDTEFVGRSMTASRFLWNAANVTRSDAVRKFTARTADTLRLDRIKFRMNLRDMMRVIIEKPVANG